MGIGRNATPKNHVVNKNKTGNTKMTQVINLRVIRDDGIGRVGALIRLHRKASFEAVCGAHFRFVVLLVVTRLPESGGTVGRQKNEAIIRSRPLHR